MKAYGHNDLVRWQWRECEKSMPNNGSVFNTMRRIKRFRHSAFAQQSECLKGNTRKQIEHDFSEAFQGQSQISRYPLKNTLELELRSTEHGAFKQPALKAIARGEFANAYFRSNLKMV